MDEYDGRLTQQWSTVARDIHENIETNFEIIHNTINMLIGLLTIVLGLVVGPVIGLLIRVVRMAQKVKWLREGLTVMKARAIEGLTLRKGSEPYFSRSKGMSDL